MNEPIATDVAPVTTTASVIELDIHRLDLRFERTRLSRGGSQARLVEAIASQGLRLPVRVADTGESLVLIDGFRRLQAYRLLERDRIPACCSRQSLEEALREWFADQQGRGLDAIEEAWLIEQLLDEGRSRQEIARWMGRGASWLSRRIALLEGLDDKARQALRDGVLSPWAAERVWIPLARANGEQAHQLLQALYRTPLSSRELVQWRRHYQAARGEQRQRLLEQPRLFIDTLKTPSANSKKADAPPGAPPDVRWLRQFDRVIDQLGELERRLPGVIEAGLELTTVSHIESQTTLAQDRLAQIAQTLNAII
jgi:ParB/RepB/Spo0J family partition protein